MQQTFENMLKVFLLNQKIGANFANFLIMGNTFPNFYRTDIEFSGHFYFKNWQFGFCAEIYYTQNKTTLQLQ
jgi:hypothetical protein